MKPLTFRCTKVIHEEKRVHGLHGDRVDEAVNVHLDLVNPSEPGTDPTFGYVVINLSVEKYNESRYEVGKEYMLTGVVTLDSVTQS